MNQTAPFIIKPAPDLLKIHPELENLSQQLSLAYASNKLVTDQQLQQLGSSLWSALNYQEQLAQAKQQAGMNVLPLIILSEDAKIQQLPWEILYHPEYHFLARNPAVTTTRSPTEIGQKMASIM